MNIPAKFTQGDTFTWVDRTNQSLVDGEWSLTVSFRGPSAIDLTATRQDSAFTFVVGQDIASKFRPGRYRWVSKLRHVDQNTTPFSKQVIGDLLIGSYQITNCDNIDGVESGMSVTGDAFTPGTKVDSTSAMPNTIYLTAPILLESTFYQCLIESPAVLPSPYQGQQVTVEEGVLDVLPDLATYGAGFDARTQTEKDLEAVDQAIRAMISGGAVQEYQIGNRSVKKMSMEALQTLRSRLQYQLARERKTKNSLNDPSNVLVRFTR